MIKLKNLCFRYGARTVLNNLSEELPTGSSTALMGASGIGKTTLLRILMGLEKVDSGTIEGLEGKKIAAVFQEDRLLPHLTVYHNLRLVTPKGTDQDFEEVLSQLGLAGIGSLYPAQLSGGMQRRVAIARALCYSGDFYLLDEPLKGLDEATRKQVAQVIRNKTAGKTLLIVTHHQEEAQLLCDRVWQL